MAEGTLASVIVQITADASDFIAGLKDASDSATAFAETGGVIAAAGAAIVGAFTAVTVSVSEAGTQFDLMHQRLGISASDLSALSYAASLSGVDIDSLGKSLQLMSKNVSDLASPTSAAATALAGLGVNTTNSNGTMMSAQQIMLAVSDVFASMPDGVNKTADAMAIFGRSGAAMIPFLDQGSASIQDLMQKAGDLGDTFTDQSAAAAHAFDDALTTLHASLTGLENTIASEVMPTIEGWVTDATSAVSAVQQWTAANPGLTEGLDGLGVTLAVGGTLIVGIGALTVALPLLTGAFEVAGAAIMAMPWVAALLAIAEMLDQFRQYTDAVNNNASANETLGTSIGHATAVLQLHGVQVDTTNMSVDQATQTLAQAGQAYAGYMASVNATTNSQEDLATQLRNSLGAQIDAELANDDAATAAANYALSVDKVINAVQLGTPMQMEMNSAIQWMLDNGTPTSAIVASLGSEIIKAGDSALAATGSFGDVNQALYDQSVQMQIAIANGTAYASNSAQLLAAAAAQKQAADAQTAAQDAWNTTISKGSAAVYTLTTSQNQLVAILDNLSLAQIDNGTVITALGPQIITLGDRMNALGIPMDAATQGFYDFAKSNQAGAAYIAQVQEDMDAAAIATTNWNVAVDKIADSAVGLTDKDLQLIDAMNQWTTEGTSVTAVTNAQGSAIIKLGDQIIANGVALDSNTQSWYNNALAQKAAVGLTEPDLAKQLTLINDTIAARTTENIGLTDQIALYKEILAEMPTMTLSTQAQIEGLQAMATAFNGLSTSISGDLTKVILGTESWGAAMTNIASTTATDMLNALIKGFISPLTDALSVVGKDIGQWINGDGSAGVAGPFSDSNSFLGILGSIGSLFLGIFDTGTNSVSHDGLAFVHAGEAIVPAAVNQQFMSAMGGSGPSSTPFALPSGGTSLAIGSSDTANTVLLAQILAQLQQGQTMVVDGKILGQITAKSQYKLTRYSGMTTAGAQ